MGIDETLAKWMPQPSGPRRKRRAVIYDFDNTLWQSHGRETGEPLYLEKTGQKWPHSGWWGRVETLMPPFVIDPITEDYFVADVLAAYRVDRAEQNTNCYLMTGRPAKMRHRVRQLLDAAGVTFDDYYFRGMKGQPGHGDTLEIKLDLIQHQIIHPALEVLEIWEDRPEHASRFMTEARRWKGKFDLQKIVVHEVLTNEHHEF